MRPQFQPTPSMSATTRKGVYTLVASVGAVGLLTVFVGVLVSLDRANGPGPERVAEPVAESQETAEVEEPDPAPTAAAEVEEEAAAPETLSENDTYAALLTAWTDMQYAERDEICLLYVIDADEVASLIMEGSTLEDGTDGLSEPAVYQFFDDVCGYME